jgi:hypothetical protein
VNAWLRYNPGSHQLDATSDALGTEVNDTGADVSSAATNLSDEARANCCVLADTLAGAGLVNYPTQ